jgi:GNAT superfamily N-acetyltransferase
MTDIAQLDAAHSDRAHEALSRAFFDYNVMVYAAPNSAHRAAGVATVYGAILADCLRWGEVYGTTDGVGAACWLPPGRPLMTLPRQLRSGMLRLPWRFGLVGFSRLVAYDNMARRLHHLHAANPHWYLAAIGVEPRCQGRGIGGALMQPILARADADRLPCYLETHKPENVRLYQRHGFGICCHAEVPGHPLPIWAMSRNPRRPAG